MKTKLHGCLLVLLLVCLVSCRKDVPVPEPRDPGYASFTIFGSIQDSQGNSMRGMPIKISTNFKSQDLITDGNGEYQATVFQGYTESTKFTFVNEIGDKVYFQHMLNGPRNQRLNFNLDQKGSVTIAK